MAKSNATRNADEPDTWDGTCPEPGCNYTSLRHATRKAADARIAEHLEEPHREQPTAAAVGAPADAEASNDGEA